MRTIAACVAAAAAPTAALQSAKVNSEATIILITIIYPSIYLSVCVCLAAVAASARLTRARAQNSSSVLRARA